MANARVLVIDDEFVLRAVLRDMLSSCGYQADVAEDGPTAIAHFQQRRYDAVITDLTMPGMDGFEVVSVLRTIDPAVKVIMLTGSAPEQTAGRARETGLTLLHKPVGLGDLKAAVDAACEA